MWFQVASLSLIALGLAILVRLAISESTLSQPRLWRLAAASRGAVAVVNGTTLLSSALLNPTTRMHATPFYIITSVLLLQALLETFLMRSTSRQ
jgi:hypothetical protein